jgi:hypothetical protein
MQKLNSVQILLQRKTKWYQTFIYFISELVNLIGWDAAFHFVALKHHLIFECIIV